MKPHALAWVGAGRRGHRRLNGSRFERSHAQGRVPHRHDRDLLGSDAKVGEDSLRDQMIHGAEGAHGNDLALQFGHASNLRPGDQIKAWLGDHREHAPQRRALDGPADAGAEGGGVVDAAAQNAGQRNGGSDLNELRRDPNFPKIAFGLSQKRRKVIEIASNVADNNPLFLRRDRTRTVDSPDEGEKNPGEKKAAPAAEPKANDTHEQLPRRNDP